MNRSQVRVGNGQLTLTASPVTGQPPTKGGLAIQYLSGTVFAKPIFTVKENSGYEFSGHFCAPTAKGTWPAFWLTGVESWPPEIDLAEWKGSKNIWFNSVGVNRAWSGYDVYYPDPEKFHDVFVQLQDYNGVDVQIKFYLDGTLQTMQIGKGMIGEPFWLYVCLFISHNLALFDLDYSSGYETALFSY